MRKFLLISLLLAALTIMSSYANANLLTNSGFETGDLTNWNPWSANYSIYSWGHNGSNFSTAAWWWAGGWQTVSIADPSVPTKVGGWIFDDVASGQTLADGVYAQMKVEFKTAADAIVGTWSTGQLTGIDLTDNSWNDKTTTVTPSSYGANIAKATSVWEVNNSGAGSGRGIFDDMIVEPQVVPEPASLLMLSFGLVGLGIFTKKRIK